MNVQMISQETIKPSVPTPDHLHYLQVSLLDQLNAPYFMPTIFFFNTPKNTTPHETSDAFLHKLKASLSTTLSIYYPLAGRIRDSSSVVCNDQGVQYLHTLVRSTCLEDVVHKAQVSDLDKLMPYHGQNEFSRVLLAVQVNSFSCGGVAIGVKMSHRISDGFSKLMFLNAWADITNGKDPKLLPRPYFDTGKLFPSQYNPIDEFKEPNVGLVTDTCVAKWFMFTREKLVSLRSKLCSSENMSRGDKLPSIFTVLSAFIWSRIILSTSNKNDNNRVPYQVYIPVNIRPKLSNPGDNSFYSGNMIVNVMAKPSCTLDDNESLCLDFMEKVNESVEKLRNDHNFVKDVHEGKQDLRFVTRQYERVSKGEIKLIGFSNGSTLRALEPDFGWGKPVWIANGSSVEGVVVFSPVGPHRRDIVASINLSREDMIKLEADEVFNSLVFKKAATPACSSKL